MNRNRFKIIFFVFLVSFSFLNAKSSNELDYSSLKEKLISIEKQIEICTENGDFEKALELSKEMDQIISGQTKPKSKPINEEHKKSISPPPLRDNKKKSAVDYQDLKKKDHLSQLKPIHQLALLKAKSKQPAESESYRKTLNTKSRYGLRDMILTGRMKYKSSTITGNGGFAYIVFPEDFTELSLTGKMKGDKDLSLIIGRGKLPHRHNGLWHAIGAYKNTESIVRYNRKEKYRVQKTVPEHKWWDLKVEYKADAYTIWINEEEYAHVKLAHVQPANHLAFEIRNSSRVTFRDLTVEIR